MLIIPKIGLAVKLKVRMDKEWKTIVDISPEQISFSDGTRCMTISRISKDFFSTHNYYLKFKVVDLINETII